MPTAGDSVAAAQGGSGGDADVNQTNEQDLNQDQNVTSTADATQDVNVDITDNTGVGDFFDDDDNGVDNGDTDNGDNGDNGL